MSAPSKITCPLSGVSNPPRMRRVVVLPHPLGPNRVKNSFSRIERFRSFKTICPSKDLLIFFKSIKILFMTKLLPVSCERLKAWGAADPDKDRACLVVRF